MRKSGRKRGDYVSEFTRFIDDYLERHPEVVADQRLGRSMYWDKRLDLKAIEEAVQDSVHVDAYYYFGDPTRH